ncbi:hypothetical protein GU90_08885 [Saccharopolyspora rectivirgula]|uniref:Uncharacterized protein n=1 Tax=Saccharopolyspora rectivirgula TaxID=28042 RepID=A0A073AZA4_9PSEU|nr:hypothetical protein GU90_08885 [Saccharopolyspora rectivirgula]
MRWHHSARPASSSRDSTVPVGFAGLATISPWTGSSSCSSSSTVGWNRVVPSVASSTTSQPSARRMLR